MKLAPVLFAGALLVGSAAAAEMAAPYNPVYPGSGVHPPAPHPRHAPARGLHLERGADAQAYYLRIHAGGLDPKAVQVRPAGRSLIISVTRSHQAAQQQAPVQGQPGYTHWGYSSYRSSGTLQRRISVPRDADMGAMQRTDNDEVILITLPRLRVDAPPGRHD